MSRRGHIRFLLEKKIFIEVEVSRDGERNA
jgi:hypothetical protein